MDVPTEVHASTNPSPLLKKSYEMQQNHNWLVDGPDGSAFTLLATPIVGSAVSTKDAMSMNLKAMVKSTPASPNEVRPLAVTHVHQLYAGEHGTTRLVVVCRIEEGIVDAKEAKSGACGLGRAANGGGRRKAIWLLVSLPPLLTPSP